MCSPTGSGKTLAAFLWCINDLYRMGREGALDDAIHVLYVSPLKALNNDIQRNLVESAVLVRAILDGEIDTTRVPTLCLDVLAQHIVGAVAADPWDADALLARAVRQSPVFASRFRHNAVRALLVLRHYRGRRTPVWLQSLRAGALLEACGGGEDFPFLVETVRECLHEALDAPGLRRALADIASGAVAVETVATRVPSPFTHTLLLIGQYGEFGTIPTRERQRRSARLCSSSTVRPK